MAEPHVIEGDVEAAVRELKAKPGRELQVDGGFDVEGSTLVAAHPQPNENAWLIGQALMNAGLLPTQLVMGMVAVSGLTPTVAT